MRGTPCVMFMAAIPAKWNVLSVICVPCNTQHRAELERRKDNRRMNDDDARQQTNENRLRVNKREMIANLRHIKNVQAGRRCRTRHVSCSKPNKTQFTEHATTSNKSRPVLRWTVLRVRRLQFLARSRHACTSDDTSAKSLVGAGTRRIAGTKDKTAKQGDKGLNKHHITTRNGGGHDYGQKKYHRKKGDQIVF